MSSAISRYAPIMPRSPSRSCSIGPKKAALYSSHSLRYASGTRLSQFGGPGLSSCLLGLESITCCFGAGEAGVMVTAICGALVLLPSSSIFLSRELKTQPAQGDVRFQNTTTISTLYDARSRFSFAFSVRRIRFGCVNARLLVAGCPALSPALLQRCAYAGGQARFSTLGSCLLLYLLLRSALLFHPLAPLFPLKQMAAPAASPSS
jgi:hypothetical protein